MATWAVGHWGVSFGQCRAVDGALVERTPYVLSRVSAAIFWGSPGWVRRPATKPAVAALFSAAAVADHWRQRDGAAGTEESSRPPK